MGGAAWNTNKKSDKELFEEQVINRAEYYDLDIPTMEEYVQQRWNQIKDTDKQPNGMAGHWSWRLQVEKEYKKLYGKQA